MLLTSFNRRISASNSATPIPLVVLAFADADGDGDDEAAAGEVFGFCVVAFVSAAGSAVEVAADSSLPSLPSFPCGAPDARS